VSILAEPARDDFRVILQDALGTNSDLIAMASAVPFFVDGGYLKTRAEMDADG
jgi:hypothetical protein